MKKFLAIIVSVVITLTCAIGLSACSENLGEEQLKVVATAYLEYVQKTSPSVDETETVRFGGEYFGNQVFIVHWSAPDISVISAVVDYVVGDVLVCRLPDPSYDVIVYNVDAKTVKDLKTAYNDGDIAKKTLTAIKLRLG